MAKNQEAEQMPTPEADSVVEGLKQKQKKIFEAREKAKLAAKEERTAEEEFQKELRATYAGKRVVVSGPVYAREQMIQDGYEMFQVHGEHVDGFDGVVTSVWARNHTAYDQDQPLAYIRGISKEGYRQAEISVELFKCKVEIVEDSEATTPEPSVGGRVAVSQLTQRP